MTTKTVAIVGLGYVGLPLAIEFGKHRRTIGFDVDESRISMLSSGIDTNLEANVENLKASKFLIYSSCEDDLSQAQIYIVAVPTPIDENHRPDLTLLIKASRTIGKVLKKNDIVIYESTVYPGVTEDICVPVLEKVSGLRFNVHFFCGYSPERINPGDKINTLTTIRKITSGSTPTIAREIDELYREIIKGGTYLAPSIKVAEAAKVTENCQRDLNIAFINELSRIFYLMDIDTHEVLEAAKTKWNFLPFEPGLVGGHCIAVDPYYLSYRAQQLNYNPQILLAARHVNDTMPYYIVAQVIKIMLKKGINVIASKVLVLGITFKENCPDIRNSKSIPIIQQLKEFGCHVDVVDPWASTKQVFEELNLILKPINELPTNNQQISIDHYDVLIITVAHREFLTYDYSPMMTNHRVIYDIKAILPKANVDGRL